MLCIRRFAARVGVVAALLAGPAVALATDFRVETEVFSIDGTKEGPVSENLTVFHAGKVYSFQQDPREITTSDRQRRTMRAMSTTFATHPPEITIFDRQRQRIVLLDPARKLQAEIHVQELLSFGYRHQEWAARQDDPLLKFAAEPVFETPEHTDDKDKLVWTSEAMTYEVAADRAKTDDAAAQYREFSDLYARLNAFTNPGSPPPFPRLKVNEALAAKNLIPTQVWLTTPDRRLGKKDVALRSEHRTLWRLSEADVKKCDHAGEMLVSFPTVGIAEYLRPAAPPAVAEK